jgi:hypothetical protein
MCHPHLMTVDIKNVKRPTKSVHKLCLLAIPLCLILLYIPAAGATEKPSDQEFVVNLFKSRETLVPTIVVVSDYVATIYMGGKPIRQSGTIKWSFDQGKEEIELTPTEGEDESSKLLDPLVKSTEVFDGAVWYLYLPDQNRVNLHAGNATILDQIGISPSEFIFQGIGSKKFSALLSSGTTKYSYHLSQVSVSSIEYDDSSAHYTILIDPQFLVATNFEVRSPKLVNNLSYTDFKRRSGIYVPSTIHYNVHSTDSSQEQILDVLFTFKSLDLSQAPGTLGIKPVMPSGATLSDFINGGTPQVIK